MTDELTDAELAGLESTISRVCWLTSDAGYHDASKDGIAARDRLFAALRSERTQMETDIESAARRMAHSDGFRWPNDAPGEGPWRAPFANPPYWRNLAEVAFRPVDRAAPVESGVGGSSAALSEDGVVTNDSRLRAELERERTQNREARAALAPFAITTSDVGRWQLRCDGSGMTGYRCGINRDGREIYRFDAWCKWCAARKALGVSLAVNLMPEDFEALRAALSTQEESK